VTASTEGPRFPATAEERRVWGDFLLEKGHMPPWPWPVNDKPATVKGSAVEKVAASLMARLAAANATLANLDEQRTEAEAMVESTEKALTAMGINSLGDLTRLDGRRDYRVCKDPQCESVNLSYWESDPEWRCDEHRLPPVKPPVSEPASAEKETVF
jgi:hypothetical protein